MTAACTILRIEGAQDGIRFGRARWPDGVRLNFVFDRLSGAVRLLNTPTGTDAYVEIPDPAKAAELRDVLAKDARA